jgi:hypothetical protein
MASCWRLRIQQQRLCQTNHVEVPLHTSQARVKAESKRGISTGRCEIFRFMGDRMVALKAREDSPVVFKTIGAIRANPNLRNHRT